METIGTSGYPSIEWPGSLDIPLRASEEVVSIDLDKDLPDDPADLKTLLVEEGSDKEHWLTIAEAYCNHGKTDAGIRLIEMALDTFENKDKAPLHTFLTWAYLKSSKENLNNPEMRNTQLTKTEHHLKNAIGFDPTWVGNMLATIDLYYQRGHYERALETLDLFVKNIYEEDRRNGRISKPNSLFLLLRAKLLFQKKNYNASLRSFQELLVINPVMQPDPRIGIGLCFWQLKDYSIAITSWKRALEINPKDKNAAILVLLGEFHNSLSSENDSSFKENYSKVLEDLDSLYKSEKENPVLLALLQSYFYFKMNFKKVIEIYENHIKPIGASVTNTVLSESLFWCGRAYYALHDYKKAFLMFQRCLKLDEDNLLARFGLGQTQIKNKLVEEGILTFENLFKSSENNQELNYILGLLYAAKSLDSQSGKNLASGESLKYNDKAIQHLEKYIKLTTSKKNQIVVPRAYLLISQLYETQNNYRQSLEFLSKVMQQYEEVENNTIPLEVLNNIGCFHFLNGDYEKATEFFEKSKKQSKGGSAITIDYNIARSFDASDNIDCVSLYQNIASLHPAYIDARIRNILLKYWQQEDMQKIENDVDLLFSKNKNNLEVRAFYSWFLKNDKKNSRKTDDLETAHNKETLVKYDSHDLYALISLANLYCVIARAEKKSSKPKDQESSKQSYLKAVQLYQKVLQLDPFNVFAAQGIAIVFAESKRMGSALEILRKVRDSLDNIDVHVNIAHCLLEMHDYSKAIESYEFALKKYGNKNNKAYIMNLLGKAWYSRGAKERSLEFFQKALKNVEMALEVARQNETSQTKFSASLMYNVALLHFQIAETLRRSNSRERKLQDIHDAMEGLNVGLTYLKSLSNIDEFVMIPKEELEQRIQLGETTMKSALERSVKEQELYDLEQTHKLEEARKILEENESQKREQQRKEQEVSRIKLEKQKEEYRKLQDEAQKLIQERESMAIIDDEHNQVSDGEYGSGEDNVNDKKKAKKRKPSSKTSSGGKKRRKKNEDKSSERVDALLEDTNEDVGANANDDDDEDDELTVDGGRRRGRKSALSEEFIEDSDDSAGESHNRAATMVADDDEDGNHDDDNDDDNDNGDLF